VKHAFVTLLVMLLPIHPCQSQEAGPPATAAATTATASEGFFVNGSSFAVIADTLKMDRGAHIGFSFRTCSPGTEPEDRSHSYNRELQRQRCKNLQRSEKRF
jgi:hypothetical protein